MTFLHIAWGYVPLKLVASAFTVEACYQTFRNERRKMGRLSPNVTAADSTLVAVCVLIAFAIFGGIWL